MEGVKEWCLAVSAVAALSGIMITFIPKGSLKGIYRVVVCVVVLFMMTSPVSDLRKMKADFSEILSHNDGSVYDSDSTSSVLYVAEESYKRYVESLLKDYGKTQCECKCEYDGENLRVSKLIITGKLTSVDEESIMLLLENIIDENTEVELRSEECG